MTRKQVADALKASFQVYEFGESAEVNAGDFNVARFEGKGHNRKALDYRARLVESIYEVMSQRLPEDAAKGGGHV